ncbi:hypothetical protein [Fusobacterium varium]
MSYHSKYSDVYHVYENCKLGNNIEKENKVQGTGNKRKCKRCADREKELIKKNKK